MVVGPKLLDIPIEEVFFFVIQTFNTTLLYLILNKPTLHSIYLVKEKKGSAWKVLKLGGQLVLGLAIKKSFDWVKTPGHYTYMGLILVWACPFLLLLWSLAYQLLVRLPFSNTAFPIAIPTLYLWAVDSLALQRGTWVISSATKTGAYLPVFGLEAEEAVFFFLTNCLIVFGLVAFDNAIAVLNTFPAHFPRVPELPTPALLVRALLIPAAAYDDDRILGLRQSVQRLKNKSRSFYLASGTFSGRLRIDLIHLYSFCRIADDLIDNAHSPTEAKLWVLKLRKFLELAYGEGTKSKDGSITSATDINNGVATLFIMNNFPRDTQLSLLYLPTQRMDKEPLFDLLKGFEMDLLFAKDANSTPIKSEPDLDTYGACVAGTVAHLCIQLVLFHYPGLSELASKRVMAAGHDMGIALQYTNIARDLKVDAENGRCYVPVSWLKRDKMTPESFISALRSDKNEDYVNKRIEKMRTHLLDRAFTLYEKSVGAIEELPKPARASMRVAVESYMQIGRELKTPGYIVKAGRATVPAWKRVAVAWTALNGPMPKSA